MFAILIVGLAWTQIVLHDKYKREEEHQNLRRILHPGPRGKIYDRNGILLADNHPRFEASVYLGELRDEFSKVFREKRRAFDKAKEENPESTTAFNSSDTLWQARKIVLQKYLNQINAILDFDKEINFKELEEHYGYRRIMPFPLVSSLTHDQYANLLNQLPVNSPIQINTGTIRQYPLGQTAAQVIGYLGNQEELPTSDLPREDLITYAAQSKQGRSGVEKQFDETLQGISGGEIWVIDLKSYRFEFVESRKPKSGKDLVISIDSKLQTITEEAIRGKTGAVVALDVKTGEVLACASSPTYNLNDFSPFIRKSVWDAVQASGAEQNLAVNGLYPPGSTFKMVTAIAAMRNGHLEPDDKIECSYKHRGFPEHSGRAFGEIDLSTTLQVSSNVFCYHIAERTGIDALSAEAKRFGLSQPTGIELPETRSMIVPDREWLRKRRDIPWTFGNTFNTAIGQGDLLVTPLQMACFAASLARRETRTRPTLIHNQRRLAVDHGGEPIGLSDAQYSAILEGMKRAASHQGTARAAQVPGVQIAGKTGTAQRHPGGVKINLGWFLGFAPADDPEIAVVVMMQGTDVSHQYSGGKTAAPIARTVFEGYFYPNGTEQVASAR